MKFIYICIVALLLPIVSYSQIGPLPPLGACVDDASGGTWYWEDLDGDGFGSTRGRCLTGPTARYTKIGGDCNDNSAALYPRMWYLDADRDGKGNPLKQKWSCNPLSGYVTNGDDCNDNNNTAHTVRTWYLDNDGDGHGVFHDTKTACVRPSGYAQIPGDCNDNNANIHPRIYEGCSTDGLDNDCDGEIDENIPAMPTASVSSQCGKTIISQGWHDETEAWFWQSSPTGTSISNYAQTITLTSGNTIYLRARTNGPSCWGPAKKITYTINPIPKWYKDSDGDGFASTTQLKCTSPGSGYTRTVLPVTDCNDSNAAIHPNTVWYKNSDGDGFASTTKKQCTNPGSGYSLTVKPLGDCNDNNASIHPNTVWYKNSDGDGFASTTKKQCSNPGSGYSLTVKPLGDCNDGNASIHPNTVWYKNSDGDGFASTTKTQCSNPGSGYSLTVKPLGDCNDGNASIHPNTVWYKNSDGDGFASTTKKQCTNPGSGYSLTVKPLGDCNDGNAAIHPNTVWYKNSDGDGFASATKKQCTNPGSGYSLTVKPLGDCNDGNASIHPNTVWYKNSDGDGFASMTKKQCGNPGSGYSLTVKPLGDCNDTNAAIHPNTVWYKDSDGDGFASTTQLKCTSPGSGYTRTVLPVTDCNDSNAVIHPNTVWYKDSDGDGFAIATKAQCASPGSGYTQTVLPLTDCNDNNAAIHPNTVWYQDSDGDGFAIATKTQCASPGSGYTQTVLPLTDCNDNDASKHPGTIWYADTDGDGFGAAGVTKTQCSEPTGYVSNKGDLCVAVKGKLNGCEELSYEQPSLSDTENYVFTRSFQEPMTSPQSISKEEDVIENVTYYDGLGRAKQQVAIKASPASSVMEMTNELTMDWAIGQGSTGFFNRNGNVSENNREIGVDPAGKLGMLWKCGNDIDRNADGGWNTDYINVNKNVGYRYTVWVKRTGSQNGSTYHGTQNVSTLDGVAQTNPYFWVGDLPQLDTWYLMVGIIYPHNYNGTDQGVSGVYDRNGNRVIDGKEFKWNGDTANSRFRSYLYYSTDVNTNQFFWSPVVQKLDGSETPLQKFISGPQAKVHDIVTHTEYDGYGRQAKQYLPFGREDAQSGSYTTVDIHQDINSYYQNTYADDFAGMAVEEVNAYSQNIYEASPLNRVLEQGAPGTDWKADPNSDADHTIKFDWDTNTLGEVAFFEVTFESNNPKKPILTKRTEDYPIGRLHISIMKDENWTPADSLNHTIKEYKNRLGQVILKRIYNENVAHDTYYVYDRDRNLSYVLPSKVITSDGISDNELAELCYQYRYDYRNRIIEKKVAGKDWEYLVYNKLDQVILSQDMNLRLNNQWLFTKYDAFGRIVYTGIITDDRDRKTIQDEANVYTDKLWVEDSNAIMVGGVVMYYSNGGYPNIQNAEVLTINYYDDYDFLGTTPVQQLANPGTVYNEPVSDRTKSLPTGKKVKVLGTSYWTTTATYYDKKARPICIATVNEYLNTSDIVENKLDFVGKVEETTTKHKKGSNATIVIVDAFIYDDMGRLMKEAQTINGQEETIAENKYDALGQLENKTTGGGLQTVKYHYNVRGWLRGINDVDNLGNDLFAYQINYTKPTENLGASALYDGDISETLWKTANDNTKRAYGFKYDDINRLVAARSNNGKYNVTGIQYDPMGNITNLTRNGWQNSSTFTNMDVLSYQYDTGHRLLGVTDNGNKAYGFKDGSNTGNDYEYNTNGSMTIDRNKGITSISYNHLNLPTEVIFDNSSTKKYEFVYDASGQKLKKIVTNNGAITTTEYAGKAYYKNGTLQFISHAEGYVEPDGSKWIHVFQFKDHLQSLRLSYADNNRDGIVGVNEIREENNTYPFGLKHEGYNTMIRDRDHEYDYLGQERNEELGLNWLTFRYRNYMPEIGRFFGVDPVSEEYMSISTYQFAHNNPIWKIEIEGLEGEPINVPDKPAHEPVKVEQAKGNPWVTTATAGKAVQETTKEIAKKSSFLKNALRVGSKVLGTAAMLLSDSMSPNTGGETCDMCVHRGSEFHNTSGHGRVLIDERHKVDDKQINTEGDSDSPITRVFRVQGGGEMPNRSKERFIFDNNGNLKIDGTDMLFITFGDETRARNFLEIRGGDAEIVTFNVSKEFVNMIMNKAVPQSLGGDYPGSPQQVDPTKTKNSFGIPRGFFQELLNSIDQNSIRRISQ